MDTPTFEPIGNAAAFLIHGDLAATGGHPHQVIELNPVVTRWQANARVKFCGGAEAATHFFATKIKDGKVPGGFRTEGNSKSGFRVSGVLAPFAEKMQPEDFWAELEKLAAEIVAAFGNINITISFHGTTKFRAAFQPS